MVTTNSLITKTPATIAAVRGKLGRHPLARPGSKFIFDFTDPRCHPNGVIKPGVGAEVTNYTLTSLVGNVTARIVGVTGAVNADGSITTSGGTSFIAIGNAGQFDMSASPYEFLGTVWFKFAAESPTGNYWRFLDSETSANEGQFYMDAGLAGRVPRAAIGYPATVGSDAPGQGGAVRTIDTILQVAQYFKPGVRHALLINGAETAAVTTNIVTGLRANPGQMALGRGGKITSYGISLHDIGASMAQEVVINTALTAASKPNITVRDYVAHALHDYNFSKGLLPAAPKTSIG